MFMSPAVQMLIVILFPTLLLAQAANQEPPADPAPKRGAAGGGGGAPGAAAIPAGRGMNPAGFRQQQIDAIKDKLQPTDDEWTSLLPRLEKLLDARRAASTGAGMSFSTNVGRGGFQRAVGDGGNTTPDTAPGKAMAEVHAVLKDESTSNDEILKKLAALREARDKAKADLAAAQKDLKEACTPRQEATLVTLGILE